MTDHDQNPAGESAQYERGWPAGSDVSAEPHSDPSDDTHAHGAHFHWPPTEGESVLDAWGRTWRGASLHPREFFASMPRTGSLGGAVLYYLSIGIPVAGAQLFWTMVRGGSTADASAVTLGLGEWSPLMGFLFSPVYLLISLFFAAAATHLMLKLFGGAGGDYGVSTRVFAYAYSPQILGMIPVAGTFAGFVWMVVAAIIGLREAHRTTTGRAAAAVLIPLAFAGAFVLMAALIANTGRFLDTAL